MKTYVTFRCIFMRIVWIVLQKQFVSSSKLALKYYEDMVDIPNLSKSAVNEFQFTNKNEK